MDIPVEGRGSPAARPSLRLTRGQAWAAGALLLTVGAALGASVRVSDQLRALRAGLDEAAAPAPAASLELPRLDIHLAARSLRKLELKRLEALEQGVLLSEPDDYVPAELRFAGEVLPARLRLKGDALDHLGEQRWSFRVRIQEGALLGMRRFSLHRPSSRNDLGEWVFQAALRREGLVALRYRFLRVSLNGEPWGIYALEEHFAKELLEAHQRREGPILKLEEDAFWADKRRTGFVPGDPTGLQSEAAAHTGAFGLGKLLGDPARRDEFLLARDLLDACRRGGLPAHRVFACESLARFVALAQLFGAWHALKHHNLRFYYDPLSSLLEPIGFDGNAGKRLARFGLPQLDDGLHGYLAADPVYLAAYLQALERVSAPGYPAALLESLAPRLGQLEALLQAELGRAVFDRDALEKNRAFLRAQLDPVELVAAYLEPPVAEEGAWRAAVRNVQRLPVEVLGLRSAEGPDRLLEAPLLLPARRPGARGDWFRELRVPRPPGAPAPVALLCRILGTTGTRSEALLPWSAPRARIPERAVLCPDEAPRPGRHWRIDAARRRVLLNQGELRLDAPLVVPPDYSLWARPGTSLVLGPGAFVLSYGPVHFLGEAEAPIELRVEGAPGPVGRGLAVVDAPGSRFRHVRFRGLEAPRQGRWALSGAVTLYRSPAELADCLFADAAAEDAFNAVRSEVHLLRCVFRGARADAIDLDFCSGSVRACSAVASGNDACDLSGSRCELEDFRVLGAGDKGLSVGEGSVLTARRVEVQGARVGVASKDRSRLDLEEGSLRGCRVGVAVYQKKPEFGPAQATLRRVRGEGLDAAERVEVGSRLSWDERLVEGEAEGVAASLLELEPVQ